MLNEEIKNVSDLVTVVKKIGFYDKIHLYRGQTRDWPLIPKIWRDKILLDAHEGGPYGYEKMMLALFQKKGALIDNELTQLNWITIFKAQHYGLPTRLLDWTTNPLISAFFACEKESDDNEDGVIYSCSQNGYFDYSKHENPLDIKEEKLNIIYPYHITARMSLQASIFTVHPKLESIFNESDKTKLRKLIVPKECKKIIRTELYTLGITHASLFADLDHVAITVVNEIKMTPQMPLIYEIINDFQKKKKRKNIINKKR